MPPKPSSSKTTNKSQGPSKESLEAINNYLAQKPDFEKLIREAKENPRRSGDTPAPTEYDRKVKQAVKEVLEERRREAEAKTSKANMPVHPKEEKVPSGE